MKNGLKNFSLNRICILSACLFLGFSLFSSAQAETVTVNALGKDSQTAYLNAQVSAVRSVMNEMIDPSFLKSHVKELRQIIASPDNYSGKPQILSESTKNNNIFVEAKVDVNRSVLEEKLRSLGAEIVKKYNTLLAERTEYSQQVLEALFGAGSKLSVKSTPYGEINSATPITEEIDDTAVIGPSDIKEFLPQEDFVVSYYKNEEEAKKDYFFVMVKADLPIGSFEDAVKERICDTSYNRASDEMGLTMFKAPVNPGAYEIRFYNGKEASSECKARFGFKVKTAPVAVFGLERSVFAPEEIINIHFDTIDNIANTQLKLIKKGDESTRNEEIKALGSTNEVKDGRKNVFTLKAPKEEGEYELVLVLANCNGYCNFTAVHRRSYALSHIPLTVKKPKIADTPMVLLPAEIYSGANYLAFVNWPTDTEKQPILKLYKVDKSVDKSQLKPLRETSFDKKASVYNSGTVTLYESGDYQVELYEKGNDTPLLSKEFRVLPSANDLKPSIDVSSDKYFPTENIKYSYTASSDWSSTAFIALVPENTENDAKKVYQSTKSENRASLYNKAGDEDCLMRVSVPAGVYEFRMYDRNDEKGKLRAKKTITILSEQDEAKHNAEFELMIKDTFGKNENVSQNTERLLSSTKNLKVYSSDDYSLSPEDSRNDYSANSPKYDRIWWYADEPRPTYKLISEFTPEQREAFFGKPSFIRVANFSDSCDKSADEKFRDISRAEVTLGNDKGLASDFVELGKSLIMLSPDNYKQVQDAVKIASDSFDHGAKSTDSFQNALPAAAKDVGNYLIKSALDGCSESCYLSFAGSSESAATAYLDGLSDEDFVSSVNAISKFANDNPNNSKYKLLLTKAQNRIEKLKNSPELKDKIHAQIGKDEKSSADSVYSNKGDYVVKLDDSGAKSSAFIEAICKSNPKCSSLAASAELASQSKNAVNAFINNKDVQNAFKNWKNFEGLDEDWLVKDEGLNALGKDGKSNLLKQVKDIMSKTAISNRISQSSLSPNNKDVLESYKKCILSNNSVSECSINKLSEKNISDDEAYAYMQRLFDKWDESDKGKGSKAELARNLRSEFNDLDAKCLNNLESYMDYHKGKSGVKNMLNNIVSSFSSSPCSKELDLFDAYVNLKSDIEKEYRRVLPPVGKSCNLRKPDVLNNDVKKTLCNSLDSWNKNLAKEKSKGAVENLVNDLDKKKQQQIMEAIADRGCECGVSLSVVDGKLYPAGEEPSERMKDLSDDIKAEMADQRALIGLSGKHVNIEKKFDFSDYETGWFMSYIGRGEVLSCMCMHSPKAPAIGGSSSYIGSGKCHAVGATGMGDWDTPFDGSERNKRACGYYTAINSWLNNKTLDSTTEGMLQTEDDLKAIFVENDPFLTLRKKGQCNIKR